MPRNELLTGLSATSGTFGSYIKTLLDNNLIEQQRGQVRASPSLWI